MAAYYRGRTEAFNTKIGLSIGAVTVCCSLCDELPDFGHSENGGLWMIVDVAGFD
jgi:hypothetical protein